MNVTPGETDRDKWRFPALGRRIVKTSIAVFICLIICWLRGYSGQDMSAEAAITAIVCMQPYVRDTGEYALNRFAGTLIGSAWGILFLLMLSAFPLLGANRGVLYFLMALGVMMSLYSSVVIRQSESSGLAAIVFICIVISFPDIEDPLMQAANRVLDVLIGTGVAIGINIFRLPHSKNRDIVFFLHTHDLVPDRFSRIGSAVMFRLNYLYNDGAKICLISEHAPAFFVSQMSMVKVNTPLIVMDGAAIFDINEDTYLHAETIPAGTSDALRAAFEKTGTGYFIYTVHNNRTCIFHHGDISENEKKVYDVMKRSPYRHYLEGEVYDPEEVVYYKVIDTQERLAALLIELGKSDDNDVKSLRPVIRPQRNVPDMYGLYLYSEQACVENARKKLMEIIREEDPSLSEREIKLKKRYSTDRDAIHLLHEVEKYYEPVKLPFIKRHDKGKNDL